MSRLKEKVFNDESKRDVAIEIGLKVGLLERCEDHGYVLDAMSGNFEDAYKLANSLISSNDPLVQIFNGNRRELTDLIKNIPDEFGDSCPGCEKREEE